MATLREYATYPHRRGMSLLRSKAVQQRTGLSKPEIEIRRMQNRFPKPVQIGPRQIAWPDYVIDQYVADLAAGRVPLTNEEAEAA